MYQKNAEELTKNTTVMNNTFEKAGLELQRFSFQPCSDDDADCELLLEISGSDGAGGVDIKVILYDEDDRIFLVDGTYVSSDFAGYDAFSIPLYRNSQTLIKAKSAKIYVGM